MSSVSVSAKQNGGSPSKGKENGAKTTDMKLKAVVEQMKQDGCEFFLDSSNQPTVMIKDDNFQQDWPANHERVQDHIISLYYELTDGQAVKSSELQLLLALLREDCRNGERRLSQAEEAETEGDVIVQTILCYLSANEGFDGRTCDLMRTLKEIEETKLEFSSGIPVFLNVFSRRLRRRIPTLRGFGVGVVIEHKEQGSFCKLSRLENFQADDSPDGSAEVSSDRSPSNGKGLAPADDTDGQTRKESRRLSADSAVGKGGEQ